MTWPLEGGQTKIVSVDRNLRGIVKRGGELASQVGSLITGVPHLAVAGKRTLNFGETTMTFSEALVSATKEVSHGLGAKPVAVKLTLESASDEGLFTFVVTERTASVFKFRCRCDGKRNTTFTVLWEAIG